jgi:hypothetical protein
MENRKLILFFLVAFLLFAVDIGCTYTTFAIKGVPIAYEMNTVFRDWVVQDGWVISVGKFTLFKAALFAVCGWLIFGTRNQIITFILAQCTISNHLVAICSHPTLWWLDNWKLRTSLLCASGLISLFLTFYGIRYLRAGKTFAISSTNRILVEI